MDTRKTLVSAAVVAALINVLILAKPGDDWSVSRYGREPGRLKIRYQCPKCAATVWRKIKRKPAPRCPECRVRMRFTPTS